MSGGTFSQADYEQIGRLGISEAEVERLRERLLECSLSFIVFEMSCPELPG
jgi:hypothetical protein